MPAKDRYTIEILDIALDVVEFLLATVGEPPRVSAIAQELGINRTRVFRILKTLESRGYVESAPLIQGYELGPRFVEIGDRLRGRVDLRRVAEPVLVDLAWTTGDTVYLMARYGDSAVLLDRRRGHQRLQVDEPIGRPFPLHVGAAPKILLAYLPDGEQERLVRTMELTPFTEHTITDRDELRRRLAQIRTQGYAVDEEEYELDACATGAPVRDHRGQVVATVSVVTPKTRYDSQRCTELIKAVVDAARRISALLGWQEVNHMGHRLEGEKATTLAEEVSHEHESR